MRTKPPDALAPGLRKDSMLQPPMSVQDKLLDFMVLSQVTSLMVRKEDFFQTRQK